MGWPVLPTDVRAQQREDKNKGTSRTQRGALTARHTDTDSYSQALAPGASSPRLIFAYLQM